MSFIQKQVGHTTTRMIVDHYYRHVPAPDDGNRLENAWNSTSILLVSEDADLQVSEIIKTKWWRRRESNPRPKTFHSSIYMLILDFESRLM